MMLRMSPTPADSDGEQVAARDAARDAVEERLAALGLTASSLADRIGVSRSTITRFLLRGNGGSWPTQRTLGQVDEALGWTKGTIENIARGEVLPRTTELPKVSGQIQTVMLDYLSGALDGLTETERDEALAAAIREALRVAREIRNSRE